MRILSCLNGIYPRSKSLVRATRDYDRNRIDAAELESQIHNDVERLIKLQCESGLDYLSDGMLRWQDLFRPLVETCHGLQAGALRRFFDNNTFYRQPVVVSELKHEPLAESYYHAELLPEDSAWKVVLPSPYAFSRMADDRVYTDRNQLMLEFAARILKPEIERLVKMGFSMIQLNEPYLPSDGDHRPEDLDCLKKTVEIFGQSLTDGAKLCLHTYFGDAAPLLEALLEFKVDVIGVDCLETDLDSVRTEFGEKELLCGCLNSRSSLIEQVDYIQNFIVKISDKLKPKTLYVTTNADLEFLPESIARQKVTLLSGIVGSVRKQVS